MIFSMLMVHGLCAISWLSLSSFLILTDACASPSVQPASAASAAAAAAAAGGSGLPPRLLCLDSRPVAAAAAASAALRRNSSRWREISRGQLWRLAAWTHVERNRKLVSSNYRDVTHSTRYVQWFSTFLGRHPH